MMERIARALESIAGSLEKMAHPPCILEPSGRLVPIHRSRFAEGVEDAVRNGLVNMEPGSLTPIEEMPDGTWRVRGLRESGPTNG